MDHPTGQAHQIPAEPIILDKIMASTTLKNKSTDVAAINFSIIPAPRSTPSATSFTEITK